MMRPAALFYCQHSLGMGHLVRSLALAAGLAERFRVVLLNGGPLPARLRVPRTVELVDLPPLGYDTSMHLVSRDRRRTPERAQRLRGEIILRTYASLRPQLVLTELFPFGRKKFASELLPLLEAVRAVGPSRPIVACSLRDILVQRDPRDDERAIETANRYFDAILVHSDPLFARLEESLHQSTRLRVPVLYTGFVDAHPESNWELATRRKRTIIVSAGGGLVGESLLRTSIEAHALLEQPGDTVPMKLVTGPFLPEPARRYLRVLSRGKKHLLLRTFVPDLSHELRTAAASISQCGYNTALDILRSGVPALVVPFADGQESEQTDRARRLERAGALRFLEARELTPQRLAEEIRALLRFQPRRLRLDLDGRRKSARILADLCGDRRMLDQNASLPQQSKVSA